MSKIESESTLADVLGRYIAVQCEVVLSINAELEKVLESAAPQIDDDQVHDARVACRRLRSVTRVFADVFSVPEAGRLSDDARWYGLALGGIRDLDVLAARIGAALDELDEDLVLHDPRAELAQQIDYRRQIAIAGLRDATHSERYADLTAQLHGWKSRPPWAPPADKPAAKIKKYVRKADHTLAKRLRRAMAAVAAHDEEADELIHSARKAGKRHRYAAEAAVPVLGQAADKVVADRKDLQDLLGDYQDSRLASVFLRDLGGIPGRNGFTFGVLYAAEADHRRRLRKLVAKRIK
ncbi:hypothetical protein GCM10011575_06900 [Microlunatus endophyticus]|uniref:CHAD domain-containing protein n=1 Tax=Microlunatus endophyticus TaxID=1716077 RepID=A0A917S213_9ACTN|nr:CHAD domain-containing protein [Microlunatus endophyticus]GGL51195.1 hypothetical protein GCM10011575_06900 [Microlunatus endophyticus]